MSEHPRGEGGSAADATTHESEWTALAERAAAGDVAARRRVHQLIEPIISYQTTQFCKRFCRNHRYQFRCTLPQPLSGAPADALYCEWGNASLGWMLDYLVGGRRLLRYEGRDGASLYAYLYAVANSLPFYERWKDWRFGRRVRVPEYIRELGDDAPKVFHALQHGDAIPLIAQQTGIDEATCADLAERIVLVLTQRRRLHLLNPPQVGSLSHGDGDEEFEQEFESPGAGPELQVEHLQLAEAWQQLTPEEQYVLEAMLVEERDALEVLECLASLNIAIHPKVAPADTDRQQLYYFRRKALAKLTRLAGYAATEQQSNPADSNAATSGV